jgi:hypothetical protein
MVPLPRLDRADITDSRGRHIPAVRRKLEPKDNKQDAGSGVALPRSGRELAKRLDELSSRIRRLAPPTSSAPERFHEERSEIARELQRLAEWAGGLKG